MKSKEFDAVQFMRQMRETMSAEMRGMSFEEQRAYIERQASEARRVLQPHRKATTV